MSRPKTAWLLGAAGLAVVGFMMWCRSGGHAESELRTESSTPASGGAASAAAPDAGATASLAASAAAILATRGEGDAAAASATDGGEVDQSLMKAYGDCLLSCVHARSAAETEADLLAARAQNERESRCRVTCGGDAGCERDCVGPPLHLSTSACSEDCGQRFPVPAQQRTARPRRRYREIR